MSSSSNNAMSLTAEFNNLRITNTLSIPDISPNNANKETTNSKDEESCRTPLWGLLVGEEGSHRFYESRMILGKSRHRCNIRLTDERISNVHCIIYLKNNNNTVIDRHTIDRMPVFIKDLSTNGTYVNDVLIGKGNERELRPQDRVGIVKISYETHHDLNHSKMEADTTIEDDGEEELVRPTAQHTIPNFTDNTNNSTKMYYLAEYNYHRYPSAGGPQVVDVHLFQDNPHNDSSHTTEAMNSMEIETPNMQLTGSYENKFNAGDALPESSLSFDIIPSHNNNNPPANNSPHPSTADPHQLIPTPPRHIENRSFSANFTPSSSQFVHQNSIMNTVMESLLQEKFIAPARRVVEDNHSQNSIYSSNAPGNNPQGAVIEEGSLPLPTPSSTTSLASASHVIDIEQSVLHTPHSTRKTVSYAILPSRQVSWAKHIGKGAYGTVYYGIDNLTGRQLAIKVLHGTRYKDLIKRYRSYRRTPADIVQGRNNNNNNRAARESEESILTISDVSVDYGKEGGLPQ
ncbi:FHA domain containing protein, putative [Angomonas deanei]|uniref:FHA domain containing protein, putative n=1 Tax=Angomonas deanei TaxID=59799 RepID=A0A7G2CHK7_9TRYP|nr:FHA domain containing protein, putative [Angomonas deanei]